MQKPLKDYLYDFLDYCEIEKGLSANTQRNYEQYLKLFFYWLKITGQQDLLPSQLSKQHIWEYRLFLARKYKTKHDKHLTKKSQNYYLIALRSFLDFLSDKDIETLPSSKVKLAKQDPYDKVDFLTVDEIEQMFNVIDTTSEIGLRNRAILELLFSSGMRVSELISLNKEQFQGMEKEKGSYELHITGKGNRTRTVFVSKSASDWIKKYLKIRKDNYKPLFINYKSKTNTKRLTQRSVQNIVKQVAIKAGIMKKVTPHVFRHSYATNLLFNGADLRAVQELLGHKNISTTQVYTHLTNKRLKEVHEKFHSKS